MEELDDDEIGLSAATINRHRTQLTTILAHLAENGYAIGTVSKSIRAKDPQSADEKRRPFSNDEGRLVMSGAPWNMVGRAGGLNGSGRVTIDAQFWVFPVSWYMLKRLGEVCGLMVDDIDFENAMIMIRDNALRRVKNERAKRSLPMHAELVRLGFLVYARRLKELGQTALFPELHGFATQPTVLFNKLWIKTFDRALPNARAQMKTMHSTRKTGNSAMIRAKIIDATRYYIMGMP